jgi:hypothetical protein
MADGAKDTRTVFSPEELLASGDYQEPLIANGVRCHGGFDREGRSAIRSCAHSPSSPSWRASAR